MVGYKYWGYIAKYDDGTWAERRGVDKPIDPCQLPEEFKTKIAMLDFMNDNDKLPCGSHKVRYSGLNFLAYYLFTEVSSTREE